jgi:hypothetical protein
LTGVKGRDLEEILLTQDPGFRELVERRRRYRGPLVSHEALRAQAERELARERTTDRRRPKVRAVKK